MAMNTPRVIAGGLVAGAVLNVIDWFVYTKLLADRMNDALEHYKPGSSAVMMSGNAITVYVITDFVIGLLLVWTYAAVRPRLGPGPMTAATVAFLFWIFAAFLNASSSLMTGMMGPRLFWMTELIGLICFIIGAVAGSALYKEAGEPAAA
jgi:hypothetical protein